MQYNVGCTDNVFLGGIGACVTARVIVVLRVVGRVCVKIIGMQFLVLDNDRTHATVAEARQGKRSTTTLI